MLGLPPVWYSSDVSFIFEFVASEGQIRPMYEKCTIEYCLICFQFSKGRMIPIFENSLQSLLSYNYKKASMNISMQLFKLFCFLNTMKLSIR